MTVALQAKGVGTEGPHRSVGLYLAASPGDPILKIDFDRGGLEREAVVGENLDVALQGKVLSGSVEQAGRLHERNPRPAGKGQVGLQGGQIDLLRVQSVRDGGVGGNDKGLVS